MFHPSYMHSFAMTEHYIVFIEHPITVKIFQMAFAGFTRKSIVDCTQFFRNQKVSNCV